jgi:hypothetical protein
MTRYFADPFILNNAGTMLEGGFPAKRILGV